MHCTLQLREKGSAAGKQSLNIGRVFKAYFHVLSTALFIFYYVCMGVLSAHISVYHVHAWCPLRLLDPLEREL